MLKLKILIIFRKSCWSLGPNSGTSIKINDFESCFSRRTRSAQLITFIYHFIGYIYKSIFIAGKIFSILSVFDNAVPLFSGSLYSQLYNATIKTMPSAIYWLTAGSQLTVLLLIL